MPLNALPCVVCGTELLNVFPNEVENQPSEGVVITTYGNYGSTVFDPMTGEILEMNICDPCLRTAGEKGRVLMARHKQPVEVENMGLCGWAFAEYRPVPWNKGIPGDGKRIHLGVEDLDDLPVGIELHIPVAQIKAIVADEG